MNKYKIKHPISLKHILLFSSLIILVLGVSTFLVSTLVRSDDKLKAEENNYTINDVQGSYWDKGSVSIDEVEDEYGFALGSSPSAEEACLEPEALSLIKELIVPLIDKSPKHAFAYLLKATGINGQEFEQILGDGEAQGSLARCSPWSHKESGMTQ